MSDCVFCRIANKEISSEIIIAFKDLSPKAKIHFLIVPKRHYDTVLDIDDEKTMKDIFKAIKEISEKYNIDKDGFRLINNCKEYGGQEVMHMHIHMLAGEKLKTTII